MSDHFCLVLVVDQDRAVFDQVERALDGLPVALLRATDRASALIRCRSLLANVVLLDTTLDDPPVPLHDLFGGDTAIDFVLLASDPTQLSLQEATTRGASAILSKPINASELREVVSGFIAQAQVRQRTKQLDDELVEAYSFEGIVGRSPAMLQVFSKLRRIAPLFQTALITGQTGTGKELVATALHSRSPRKHARLAICNCSALVETLLESQLFGHVKGAFTGASQDKAGLFEYANHGTLFLDEIGELPLTAQATLLRVLQSQELQRVGSPVTYTVDVNVIAATNRNLRELVSQGKFREDLYYRISMNEIHLPPLAERREDLPLLQRYFLQRYSLRYGKPIRGLSQRSQLLFAQYPWPGNVRELENVIGNACMMAQSDVIRDTDLPESIRDHMKHPTIADPQLITFDELQVRHLQYVLAKVQGNKVRAAQILGVSRATLYDMLARRASAAMAKSSS
jgi:DNA-binding NtrC family response regulator